jgi:hypothetical protein
MATHTTTPILRLEALEEFPTVEISGTRYALRPPDALPLSKIKRFQSLAPRLDALWNQEQHTADDDREISLILRGLTEICLEAPGEVLDTLVDAQHWMIYRAFLGLSVNVLANAGSTPQMQTSGATTDRGGPRPPTASRPTTGARASRGSRVSTGAIRTGGTPTSRSGSPGRR